ncbi:MAG: hypothetical protein Q7S47_02500 [bacterium]|nr:hypothetical protein [bacterium]
MSIDVRHIHALLEFIEKTGETVAFIHGEKPYVITPMDAYISKIECKRSTEHLTEKKQIDRINEEIAQWHEHEKGETLAIDSKSAHATLEVTHVQEDIDHVNQ